MIGREVTFLDDERGHRDETESPNCDGLSVGGSRGREMGMGKRMRTFDAGPDSIEIDEHFMRLHLWFDTAYLHLKPITCTSSTM